MSQFETIRVIADACCRLVNQGDGRMSSKGKSACGIALIDEASKIISERTLYLGECTPPEAEYLSLEFALDCAVEFTRKNLIVWMDSELVIKQMNGDYCIKSPKIKKYFDLVKMKEQRFCGTVQYFHHNRGSFWARYVDTLANQEYSLRQSG